MPNLCPHRGGPLKFGYVDGKDRIVCPMHHNAFSCAALAAATSTLRLSPVTHEAARAGASLWRDTGDKTVSFPPIVLENGSFKLANVVTLSRGVLIAPIIALLGAGHDFTALIVYGCAAATDVLDGWIARLQGSASESGARLDAIVDNLFSLAILWFLCLAFPGIAADHWIAIALLFGTPLLYLGVSYLMTGRLLMFHFWTAKLGALLLFALWPLLRVTGWDGFVPLAAAVVTISRLEQVAFILRGGRNLDAPHLFAKVRG